MQELELDEHVREISRDACGLQDGDSERELFAVAQVLGGLQGRDELCEEREGR